MEQARHAGLPERAFRDRGSARTELETSETVLLLKVSVRFIGRAVS